MTMGTTVRDGLELVNAMAVKLNSVKLDFYVKDRADGPYGIVEVAAPAERFFRVLKEAQGGISEDNLFKERATISRRASAPTNRLSLPETQLFKATLSESLTVDRYTFSDNFFGRYIRSVFGFEDQVVSAANYLIYGRRGAGKSSLLAYAMHRCKQQGLPYAWVDMQVYADRDDAKVAIDVVSEVLDQLSKFGEQSNEFRSLKSGLAECAGMDDTSADRALMRLLPRLKSYFSAIVDLKGNVSVFIDDLHVVSAAMQPQILARLYSITRGNRSYLKISGIEQFTRPWDSKKNIGLQAPNDAQVLKLDYNLTMPDKSRDHIASILDAHARFCGLPDSAYISGEGVLSRLVWVAAAVPRDALNLFAQAITKASAQGQRRVSITSVNAAASEMAEQKLRDMQQDAHGQEERVQAVLGEIRKFCVTDKRKNAFLLEIKNEDAAFRFIQELIALRFVHVLHEGITPHEAGRRYQALMLDYGFYVGIRAARSVDLFQKDPKTPTVQELRKLPIFTPGAQINSIVDD